MYIRVIHTPVCQGDEGKLIVEFKMVLKMNKNYRPPDCDLTCITKNVKINLEASLFD